MTTETPVRVVAPEDLPRPPRHATRRNPALRTRGGKIGVLAAQMGKPLKPHQQYAADVYSELNPPGSRLYWRYQLVLILLPRQTGKTTLMRPTLAERTLSRPNTSAFMTAQSRKDATARWADLIEDIEVSPNLAAFTHLHKSQGSERCTWPNGSMIAPFTPNKTGLHGEDPECVLVDEGWAFSKEEGGDLLQAIRPAQITKTRRQLFIISARGDHASTWLDELIEDGIASLDDPHTTMAFFDWSADPELDPMDPKTWEFHPGLEGLITIEDLAEQAKTNSHADFLRGFLNRSTKGTDTHVINLSKWAPLAVEYSEPIRMADLHIAYDVAIDGTAATVYGATVDQLGVKHLVLIETREGHEWLVDYLDHLLTTTPPASISADDGGPTRVVTAALERKNHVIHQLSGKESSTAWATLKTEIEAETPNLKHDPSTAFEDAVKLAVETKTGDTTSLSRSRSLGPIDPVIAATVAAWQAAQLAPQIQVW